MKSGKTLWEELCERYYAGTDAVRGMHARWLSLEGAVDPEVFSSVMMKLDKQVVDAAVWRDTCLNYFQKFSKQPIPN
jgi:alpha-glucuronidase